MQGKQAKIVSPTQERAILGYLATTRYPARDRVIFLLSMKAGLRAKEMASLIWAMITDAQGHLRWRQAQDLPQLVCARTHPMTPTRTSAINGVAQFIAICSSSRLAETLGYAVSFSSL